MQDCKLQARSDKYNWLNLLENLSFNLQKEFCPDMLGPILFQAFKSRLHCLSSYYSNMGGDFNINHQLQLTRYHMQQMQWYDMQFKSELITYHIYQA